MNERKPFIVVGCGSIGKRHIKNLIKLGIQNIIAFDTNAGRLKNVKREFGVSTAKKYDEIWRQRAGAVLIATPTNLHVPIALEAAYHGCDFFVEKPLSHNSKNLKKLIEVVKNKDLITLVGCNMRFHPGLVKVKELIDQNAIGNIVSARVEVGQYLPDWHPQEDYRENYSARSDLGGGIILDAIHELDYVRWLIGEVETVACIAGKFSHLEIETEDTAEIILYFKDGFLGNVHMDYVQRAYDRSCRIIGDEGTISWDYYQGKVLYFNSTVKSWLGFENPPDWEPNQMYLDEIDHFMKCLRKEENSTLDVIEGVRVLELALAAKKSARIGNFVNLK